ncbi:glycerol dehydrogenase-like oxidoreductase [Pseudomonas sp. GM78]|uniref:glycerol dehydrogenase n=3 Tax=Pseudomonas TaxID=286 RepID=UPI0002705A34|nr:glycerol dehydrogenase [Pseudomonas sp. GM78]EJN22013.1 glycerol dehydrogenase-like oxidoreductase [Pseudomonas sp. GM78]
MTQIFAAPGRYIQGYKELDRLHRHVAWFGRRLLVITTQGRFDSLKQTLSVSFESTRTELHFGIFTGEVTRQEIQRLTAHMHGLDCDGVIGIGGGKVLDAAKAVANQAKVPLCIVPTIVSNDAPTSSLSVLYTEAGAFDDVLFYERSPDVVVVDTWIIAQAPVRLLVAGMGDALSTYFEARTCVQAHRDNFLGNAGAGMTQGSSGAKATLTSMAIAELCYRVLLEDGLQAKRAAEHQCVTKAFNRVVEANALMSGIGFESNGVATAHAVYCGFSELGSRATMYHGEYVAFGTLVMLVLEGKSSRELDAVLRFCLSIGLPVTFEDLGLADITAHELDSVARTAADPNQTSKVEPFEVTFDEMKAALICASDLGQLYKKGGSLLAG